MCTNHSGNDKHRRNNSIWNQIKDKYYSIESNLATNEKNISTTATTNSMPPILDSASKYAELNNKVQDMLCHTYEYHKYHDKKHSGGRLPAQFTSTLEPVYSISSITIDTEDQAKLNAIEDLVKQNKELKNKVEHLKQKEETLDKKITEIIKLKNRCEKHSDMSMYHAALKERDLLKNRNHELMKAVQELQANISQAQNQVRGPMKAELERLKKRNEELEKEVLNYPYLAASKRREVELLKQQLNSVSKKLAEMEKLNIALKAKMDNSQARLNLLQTDFIARHLR